MESLNFLWDFSFYKIALQIFLYFIYYIVHYNSFSYNNKFCFICKKNEKQFRIAAQTIQTEY